LIGGKRKGAGRKPVPEKKKRVSVTITMRPDQIKWVRESQRKGWLAALVEKAVDYEISSKRCMDEDSLDDPSISDPDKLD